MKAIFRFIYKVGSEWLGGKGLGRFAWFRAIRSFVLSHAREEKIETHGLVLYADTEEGIGFEGEHEAKTTELMERVLRSGDTFLDIGADIGYFSCLASRFVGEA